MHTCITSMRNINCVPGLLFASSSPLCHTILVKLHLFSQLKAIRQYIDIPAGIENDKRNQSTSILLN